jgi:hypothetical protein
MGDLAEGMERLWTPAGATGGNRSHLVATQKRLKKADRQPVATDGNRSGAHGKEGVAWQADAGAPGAVVTPEVVGSSPVAPQSHCCHC